MNKWIDEKINYLNPIVKKYTIFEPTSEFYNKLEKIDIIPSFEEVLHNINENKPPYVTFFEATKSIEKHLGWSLPRIEFHPLPYNIVGNGNYIAGKIQIGGNVREIQISSDYKKKARQLGTILAHEIAHDFLFSKGITNNNIDENEKLTDLTAIMLGMGKLTLNGIEERRQMLVKKLCYLPSSDLAYAYVKVNSLYKVLPNNYFTNLTLDAYSLVIPFCTGNFSGVMINEIKEKCSIVQNMIYKVNEVYYQIRDNQELINQNIYNIKIEPEDGNLFVNLNSCIFQQEFENIILQTKLELTDVRVKLESEYNFKAGVTLQHLKDCDIKISRKNNEVDVYLEKLFGILNKQEKYLHRKSNLLDNRFQEHIKDGRVKEALKFARKENWKVLNNLGVKYAKEKDIIALEIFDKIIQLDPNNATVHLNRGKLNQILNKENLAILDFHKSIEFEPNNATAYYNCGNSHFNLGQYSEAILDFHKSIEFEPNNATAYYNCGNSHFNLGQYLESIKNYQMAIKLNRSNHMFHESLEKGFTSLKIQYPNNPMIYVFCGNAHYNLKQDLEAIKDYQIAIKLDPCDAMSYYNCGNAHFNLKQYKEAIKNYRHCPILQYLMRN
jgi:tetratricopeptide (TPR) repeat protein